MTGELIPEAEFLAQIFPVIYTTYQQGMSRQDAIAELNRAEIFAGLWDSKRGCLTETVFQEGAARRIHQGATVAAGSTVPWEVYYDKYKALKMFANAIVKYRNHLLEEKQRRDESIAAPTYAGTFATDVQTATRDIFRNTAIDGPKH